MVSAEPNETVISARVLKVEKASDGWGAWADLAVEQARRGAADADWADELRGKTIHAFVPPPLVKEVVAGKHWHGVVTAGGVEPTFSLVPPPVQTDLKKR